MTGHECPAPGCHRRVPTHQLACRAHWFALTPATRSRVWAAYRGPGPGSDEHTDAVTAAVTELAAAAERAGTRHRP